MNAATRWAIRFALVMAAFVVIGIGRPDPASAQVDVPINVCGVNVAVLGDAGADCSGPAPVAAPPSAAPTVSVVTGDADSGGSQGGLVTDLVGQVVGDVSVGADLDAAVPVDVCGVGVGVLGDTSADCGSPEPTVEPAPSAPTPIPSPVPEPSAGPVDGGLVGGPQLGTPLLGDIGVDADLDASVPVGVCGVGVGVLGDTDADCSGRPPAVGTSADPAGPSNDGGVRSEAEVDASIPVGVCGVGVGVLGDTSSNCAVAAVTESGPADPFDPVVPDVPGTPTVPVVPGLPDLPAPPVDLPSIPSTINGLLGSANGAANPGLADLQRLLGQSPANALGGVPAAPLAATGAATTFLLWLDAVLLGGGMLLRQLSKSVPVA